MHTITIKYLSGKQAGVTCTQQVAAGLVGFLYTVGATFTVPGVGRYVVVAI